MIHATCTLLARTRGRAITLWRAPPNAAAALAQYGVASQQQKQQTRLSHSVVADEDKYLELKQLRDIKSEEFYDLHGQERRYFYYIDLQLPISAIIALMVNCNNSSSSVTSVTCGASAVQKERVVLPTGSAADEVTRARMSQQQQMKRNCISSAAACGVVTGDAGACGALAGDESELIARHELFNAGANTHKQQQQQQAEMEEQPEQSELPETPEEEHMSDCVIEEETGSSSSNGSSETSPASLWDFEKLGLLGTGGAAVVYFVRHRTTRQVFALKAQRISTEEGSQNRQTQRALKELQILKALQHPFVARLHDAFQDGANLCLVMEFYEGGNLKDVQSFCGGTLTEQEAKFYASELILALEYVHTMGFVYRDLKPQNVLLHTDGHIRLTDFGVAQHGDYIGSCRGASAYNNCGSNSNSEPQSHYGADDRVRLRSTSFVGTMDYMPPEMIQQKLQSTDVDWWSLGCLVYELIYGTPPFSNRESDRSSQDNQDGTRAKNDPATLFKEILKCRVQFPAEPKVSDDCKDFLRRLLEKHPEKRLGHRFGAGEVKQHRFFQGTQWALVGNRPAPVVVLHTGTTSSSSVSCSPCFQRFHPTSLGREALLELAGTEEVLLGTFASGDWTWVPSTTSDDDCDDAVAVKRATLTRTPSTLSNPEDTCDEELDHVLILAACQVCARDKLLCSRANYQRSLLFEARTLSRSSSFIDAMLLRRGSFHPAAATSSLSASSSSLKLQGLKTVSDDVPELNPVALLKKSAWTTMTDKAAALLN